MSKAIRWQVPFASISGTKYRVDIYDEQDGTWSGITQLMAGDTPFVTEEDSSEDFFAPIRTQSGTIEVCTLMPDGNYITLDDLLPASNIARPVRLINRDNSDAIEWQGFLSCEAYDQDYTSIPQILQLPVISILEAMASVEVSQERSTGVEAINKIVYNALNEIYIQNGVVGFSNIHYSEHAADIFTKYLDQSIFYKTKECGGYGQILTAIDAISCKQVIERFCVFMGWTCREQGTDIYFQRIGEEDGMCRQTLPAFNSGTSSYSGEVIVTQDMASQIWRGVNHKRNYRQGAKSVNVSSILSSYSLELALPECPKQSLVANPQARWDDWGEFHANNIRDYYTSADFQSIRMNIVAGSNHNDAFEASMTVQQLLQYAETMPWKDVAWYTDMEYLAPPTGTMSGNYTDYTTAFLCVTMSNNDSLVPGLMVIGEPTNFYYQQYGTLSRALDLDSDIDPYYYLYKQRTILNFYAKNGTIKISVKAMALMGMFSGLSANRWNQADGAAIQVAVQWGNRWAYIDRSGTVTQYKWGTGFQSFFVEFDENGEKELAFPVTAANNGEVTLYIFPVVKGRIPGTFAPSGTAMDDTITGFLFENVQVEYEPETSELKSDESNNNYFRMLKTHFRDEISISSEIASDLENNMSPSLLLANSTTPTSTIVMDGENVRPELDLLDRLATYYGAARQRLSLIVEHPTAAPLPLLRLNGISPDNRKYLPLAESRDWQEETSTLTCFETPNK